MGFSCELLARQFVINLHGKLADKFVAPKKGSFRFVSLRQTAQNRENEALRFAKRNERLRGEGRNSLRSLRTLNQLFRGIVCFQWVEPNFVSRCFRVRSFSQNFAGETSPDLGEHSVVFCNRE
jgi:hypothetical protein